MPLGHLLQGGTRRTTFEGMKINLDVVQLSQHSDKATDGRTEKNGVQSPVGVGDFTHHSVHTGS